MKKRFLNLFLALILVVCVLPMAVGAVAFEDCKHKNTLTARAEREATCTEVGYSQTHMYCSACHTSMVKVGNAYQAISPVIEATGHKWDKNGECTECDATCMHANKETVPGYAATCTKEGRTDGQRCADCKKPLKSQYKIAKKDHVFKGKETIVKEATCTEKGSKTVQCKTCTETTTVEIPVAEHSWKYKAAEDATCVTAGWKGGDVCATCGEARTASNVIAATGNHDFEYDSKVSDATCTAKRVNLYKCKDCEVTEEREDGSLLDHAWSSWTITKQPTCTEDGLKERKCNNCDAVETVAATKTGHSWETRPAKSPTCVEPGRLEGSFCKICGEAAIASNVLPATGKHNFVYANIMISNATCTQKRVNVYECTMCKVTEQREDGLALNHDWDAGTVTKAATCEAEGTKEFKCRRAGCNETKTEPIEKLRCVITTIEAVAPTCNNPGATAGTECASCGNGWACAACKEKLVAPTEVAALGHNQVLGETIKKATCTKDGKGIYNCTRCGYDGVEKVIPATGHDYVEQEKWTATCTKDGIKETKCTRCNDIVLERITKLGHTEVEIPAVAPTCTATGLTAGKKCSTCDEILDAQEVEAMIDHTWVEQPGLSATCTTDGYTEYEKCSVCGLEEGKKIIPAAHTFEEGNFKCIVCEASDPGCKHPEAQVTFIHQDSTCTVQGVDGWTCNACGEKSEKKLPLASHRTTVQTTAATCTAEGETVETCSVCKQVIKSIEIPMLAHSYDNGACSVCGSIDPNYSAGTPGAPTTPGTTTTPGTSDCQHDKSIVTTPATCTTSGYKIVTCTTCNKVVSKELLPALGHTNDTKIEAATCSKNGSKIVTCQRCDKFDFEVLPATGRHNYVNGICTTCTGADPNRFTNDHQDVFLLEDDAKG